MSDQVHATETYWVTKVAKLEADIQRVRDLAETWIDEGDRGMKIAKDCFDREMHFSYRKLSAAGKDILRALDGEQA